MADLSNASGTDPLINPLDPEFIHDPYPFYAQLRAEQPVYWHAGMQTWLMASYRDCVDILCHPEKFTSDYRKAGVPTEPSLLSIQTLDPPDQSPFRRLFGDALRSMDVRRLENAAYSDAEALLDRAAGVGAIDFVSEIAAPYSRLAAMRILGIDITPADYAQDAKRITDSSMPALLPELQMPGLAARSRISELLRRNFSAHRNEGVVGYLQSRPETAALPEDVLINSLRVTLLAVLSSTGRFFTLGLKTLLETPDGLSRFSEAPTLDSAVHELVRYDGPFQGQEKTCLVSSAIGRQQINAGERVVVLFGSANRDGEVFSEADQLNFHRRANRHLGFGRGNHACLGTHLGLVLSRVILNHIARKYHRTKLHSQPVMDRNPTIRGIRSMDIVLG